MKMKKLFQEKDIKHKIASVLTINVFFWFSLCFFPPMEIFTANSADFYFKISDVWPLLFAVSAALSLCVSAIELFLPDRLRKTVCLLTFSFGACMYLQALALNGHMTSLFDGAQKYTNGVIIPNLLIWLAVFAAVFAADIIVRRKSEKGIMNAVMFLSAAFVLMQTAGLLSLAVSYDPSTDSMKNYYLSTEGELELSSDRNVLFFILDSSDNIYVDEALERDPDLFDDFGGFTRYTNMTSAYSRTYPAVPYLLTGEKCYFDMPYAEYIQSAYENSSFVKDIHDLGTDVRLYTEGQYVPGQMSDLVSNCVSMKEHSCIRPFGVIKQAVKVSAYRGLPYAFKNFFSYTAKIVNSSAVGFDSAASTWTEDLSVYSSLKNGGISVSFDEKAFRLYHFFGAHSSPFFDADLNNSTDTDCVESLRGDFLILDEFIRQLREKGIYDNTTIIITSDHGTSIDEGVLRRACPSTCLLLIKPAGADTSVPMQFSNAPICQEDLFSTVLYSLCGSDCGYGRTVYDIPEGEQRDRYYYFTALFSDTDGEIALREYLITGDANDYDNWQLTGRNWDVDYSVNTVSKTRLRDIEPDAEITE